MERPNKQSDHRSASSLQNKGPNLPGTGQKAPDFNLTASHQPMQKQDDAQGPAANDPFEPIRTLLEQFPLGQDALAKMSQYSVSLRWQNGGGSFYDAASNTMVLDQVPGADETAMVFVHEINHARYHHEGLVADIMNDSREDYVSGMVGEEAEGTVLSIEAQMEMEAAGLNASGHSFPLAAEYRAANDAAYAQAQTQQPDAGEDAWRQIARNAGLAAVTEGFMNGAVQTSNSGQSYPDYYGSYWDRAHP